MNNVLYMDEVAECKRTGWSLQTGANPGWVHLSGIRVRTAQQALERNSQISTKFTDIPSLMEWTRKNVVHNDEFCAVVGNERVYVYYLDHQFGWCYSAKKFSSFALGRPTGDPSLGGQNEEKI